MRYFFQGSFNLQESVSCFELLAVLHLHRHGDKMEKMFLVVWTAMNSKVDRLSTGLLKMRDEV